MADTETQVPEPLMDESVATQTLEPHLKGKAEDVFRELWASLFFSGQVKGKTVMLCSASSGEGVTTVACGLALAGTTPPGPARVALADLNLRNPSVHEVLGLSEAPGVVDVLTGKLTASRAAQRINECLDVYTIGHANGGVLQTLQSGALQNFLASLSQAYTHVILDVAAVNPFPDAQILAGMAGNVVMVTHSGQTSREAVAQARKRLEAGGASLVGAILNFRTYPIPRFMYRRT